MLSSFERVPKPLRGAYLAVGNFDGVHEGHAALLGCLRRHAETGQAPAIALTFQPRPVEILRPEQAPAPLSWLGRKVALLQEQGASDVGVFETGRWLLGLSAREFFERVVLEQFAARGMVEGPTFGFGRDRGGDARLLGEWCAAAGLDFEVVPPTRRDGTLVSSSGIRSALAAGDVARAARWLGRPHRIRGQVVRGAGRGAALGFPTANLARVEAMVPADGVYAGFAIIGAAPPVAAAIHIGPNATFDETARGVEAHLLDFNDQLYDQMIEFTFIERLRPSRKFESIEALIDQIRDDVRRTREATARAGPGA